MPGTWVYVESNCLTFQPSADAQKVRSFLVVKRKDRLKRIKAEGCVFLRRGGRHDIYGNPSTGVIQPIPRHREIDEHLARNIIEMLRSKK